MQNQQSKPKQPVTLKLVLKGEVVDNEVEYTTSSGEVIKYVKKKRLVVPSKKNSKKIVKNSQGKLRLVSSSQHVKWHRKNKPIFDQWRIEIKAKEVLLPIRRCKIRVLFYFPDSAKRDLTNKFETLADILVDSEILFEDSFIVMRPVYLDGCVMRDRPRTEIYITIIDPTDPEYDYDRTSKNYKLSQNKRAAARKRMVRDQLKQK